MGSAALGPGQLLQAVRNVRDWRYWTGLLVSAGSASRAAHVSLIGCDVFPARGAEFCGLSEPALLFLKCSLVRAARAADPIGDRQTRAHALGRSSVLLLLIGNQGGLRGPVACKRSSVMLARILQATSMVPSGAVHKAA